ncbi:MAG: hypothetical protein WCF20_09210 [Methylovirgula sp.]
MAKVTVYRVKLYDVANDATLISRRMATPEGAKMMGGQIIEDTAVEIDEAQLENGEQWTERDFNPHRHTGFQTQVY